MSKAHRGKPFKEENPGANRGTCPVCNRTGIKLNYELEVDEKKLTVCKQCKVAIGRGKKKAEVAAL